LKMTSAAAGQQRASTSAASGAVWPGWVTMASSAAAVISWIERRARVTSERDARPWRVGMVLMAAPPPPRRPAVRSLMALRASLQLYIF
jgi:hypothetical protein